MHNDIECMLCLLLTGIFIWILWSISVRSIISMYEVIFQINWVNFYIILLMYFYDLPNRIHLVLTCHCTRHCCSHAFSETNSLRRTMQIVECSLLHQRAQGSLLLAKDPTTFCENLIYPTYTCPNPPPQIPWQSKLTRDSYALSLGSQQWTIINRPVVILLICIIECMIVFCYTNN